MPALSNAKSDTKKFRLGIESMQLVLQIAISANGDH